MKKLEIKALAENLYTVTDFISGMLDEVQCPSKTRFQINVAVEEIFVNIAHYAFTGEPGMVTVTAELKDSPCSITLTFTDGGIPYDPLAKADPDTTLSARERQIGGLGIYMVKKSMDSVFYEYKNNSNNFSFTKIIHPV